jgi:hypothetical protein
VVPGIKKETYLRQIPLIFGTMPLPLEYILRKLSHISSDEWHYFRPIEIKRAVFQKWYSGIYNPFEF